MTTKKKFKFLCQYVCTLGKENEPIEQHELYFELVVIQASSRAEAVDCAESAKDGLGDSFCNDEGKRVIKKCWGIRNIGIFEYSCDSFGAQGDFVPGIKFHMLSIIDGVSMHYQDLIREPEAFDIYEYWSKGIP